MTGYQGVKAWREKQPNIKQIRAVEGRKWRAAHPAVAREIKQRYREKHIKELRPREAEQARQRRAADPEGDLRRRRAFQKRKSDKQVTVAGRPKPDVCEICGELHIRIVFDHCHRRGHFRGWICDRCNRVLGLVKDSAELLSMLSHYLIQDALNGPSAAESAVSDPEREHHKDVTL